MHLILHLRACPGLRKLPVQNGLALLRDFQSLTSLHLALRLDFFQFRELLLLAGEYDLGSFANCTCTFSFSRASTTYDRRRSDDSAITIWCCSIKMFQNSNSK